MDIKGEYMIEWTASPVEGRSTLRYQICRIQGDLPDSAVLRLAAEAVGIVKSLGAGHDWSKAWDFPVDSASTDFQLRDLGLFGGVRIKQVGADFIRMQYVCPTDDEHAKALDDMGFKPLPDFTKTGESQ